MSTSRMTPLDEDFAVWAWARPIGSASKDDLLVNTLGGEGLTFLCPTVTWAEAATKLPSRHSSSWIGAPLPWALEASWLRVVVHGGAYYLHAGKIWRERDVALAQSRRVEKPPSGPRYFAMRCE